MSGWRKLSNVLRNADWLNEPRVKAYLRILFVIQLCIVLYLIASNHGFLGKQSEPSSTDFVSFYAAGDLARTGKPELAYDRGQHQIIEEKITEKGIGYFGFFYPPTYLLICRVLVLLPYIWAFYTWVAITFILYILALRPLLPKTFYPVAALASPAVFLEIVSGQNAFLSAALFATATRMLDRAPLLAGAAFASLCYKPHFGLIIPIALLAGKKWRAMGMAAICVACVVLISLLAFGTGSWHAYLEGNTFSRQTFENGWVDFYKLASVFAAARVLGLGVAMAYSIQIVAGTWASAIVWIIWRKSSDAAMRGASLCIGMLLTTPVILNYDLLIPGIGIAWLVWRGQQQGFLPWEKIAISFAYIVSFFSAWSGKMLHLILAPWIFGFLLILVFQRARRNWDYPAQYQSEIALSPFSPL